MSVRRKGLTRRAALAALGSLGVAAGGAAHAQPANPAPPGAVPVKGKAGRGLEAFDTAMLSIMDRHGIPGAALAIAKGGKLVLAKGYGWANVAADLPAEPTTQFGLASLSKSITAVAALKLVELGKLDLDARVFDIITDLKAPKGARVDPDLKTVTVRQCLNHSGGWDRSVSGDPVNWEPQICRAYRERPPLTQRQLISFIQTLPLDFKPGTDQRYSNVGYVLLGEVITKAAGQPYERFVIDSVLKPAGVTRAGLHGMDGKYTAGEALRYLAGTLIPLPALLLPMIGSAGAWSASVVDVARFLTSLDGSRGEPVLGEKARRLMTEPPPAPLKPRGDGTWFGLGWDSVVAKDGSFGYFKDGSYQGMRTYMKRLPNGVNWVLLYNASMEFDQQDLNVTASTVREVRKLIEDTGKYPDIDLFSEYT